MIAWLGLTFRRLRDERSSAIAFFLLVLVSSLLAALAPRLLDRVADGTLRSELLAQPVAPRSIQLIEEQRINPSSDDPMGGAKDIASTLHARLPPEVRAVVSDHAIVADSGRYTVTSKLNDPTTMRLRIQPGAETRIRMVAGRMPTDAIETAPAYTIEVAIAATSATALKAAIGDTVPLDLDRPASVPRRSCRPLERGAEDPVRHGRRARGGRPRGHRVGGHVRRPAATSDALVGPWAGGFDAPDRARRDRRGDPRLDSGIVRGRRDRGPPAAR